MLRIPSTRAADVELTLVALLTLITAGPAQDSRQAPGADRPGRITIDEWSIDTTLYAGLPAEWLAADLELVRRAAKVVRAAHGSSAVATVRNWRLLNNPADRPDDDDAEGLAAYRTLVMRQGPYPMRDVVAAEAAAETLPIVLVPDLARVRERLFDAESSLTKFDLDAALDDPAGANLPYQIGLYFEPGSSGDPLTVPCAMSELSQAIGPLNTMLKSFVSPRGIGKILAHAQEIAEAEAILRRPPETPVLGRVVVIEPIPGIWVARWSVAGKPVETRIAVPLADANGAVRAEPQATASAALSPFANGLDAGTSERLVGPHGMLRWPRPRPTYATDVEVNAMRFGAARRLATRQEWFVVTDEVLHGSRPVAVLRRAPTWQPFRDEFVLDSEPTLDPSAAKPPLLVVVLASATASQWVDLLARTRGVAASPLLEDAAGLAEVRGSR